MALAHHSLVAWQRANDLFIKLQAGELETEIERIFDSPVPTGVGRGYC
jgi:hypothetical protein